jgi:hypothetical protein
MNSTGSRLAVRGRIAASTRRYQFELRSRSGGHPQACRKDTEYLEHYHRERNHQGLGNQLIAPVPANENRSGAVQCRERLDGLLRYYYREAA